MRQNDYFKRASMKTVQTRLQQARNLCKVSDTFRSNVISSKDEEQVVIQLKKQQITVYVFLNYTPITRLSNSQKRCESKGNQTKYRNMTRKLRDHLRRLNLHQPDFSLNWLAPLAQILDF